MGKLTATRSAITRRYLVGASLLLSSLYVVVVNLRPRWQGQATKRHADSNYCALDGTLDDSVLTPEMWWQWNEHGYLLLRNHFRSARMPVGTRRPSPPI